MELIEQDEYFPLNTENRKQGFELIRKNLKKGITGKGLLVEKLNQEIYSQRQDCKDFIKNLCRSKGIEVHSRSKRKLVLGSQSEVTVQ